MKINDFNSELELMNESDVISEEKETSVNKKPMSEKTEILSKRGSHSKTFQEKKGRFETIFYNMPIHYYNEDDKLFASVDGDIEEDEKSFKTKKHTFEAIFHKEESNKILFAMKREKHQVCVSVKNQFGDHSKRPIPAFEQNCQCMRYTNVSPDTDYNCSVTAAGIKVDVVKNSNQDVRNTFVIACENLRYGWDENDKILRFISDESEETVFEIPAPFMVDAAGAYSENASFEIVSVNESVCEMSIIADQGWLSSKERKYPVSMEWSIIDNAPVNNGFVFDRKDISADGKVVIGGKPVVFKMHLPKQQSGVLTKRVKAIFHCEKNLVGEEQNCLLVLSRVVASNEESKPVTERIGVSMMSADKSEYAFDVMSEYGVAENTSYALQVCEEQNGELVATENASAAIMTLSADSAISTFAVSETDGTTEEDSSSGVSGNIGSVGTYEVDLLSGRLNMEMKDFVWEGNRMPVSINRSYQGQFSQSNYWSWSEVNNVFSNMEIGRGWRMNLMQSMVNTGLQMFGNVYKDTYTYTDESGEEIVFAEEVCESGSCTIYKDLNGLGYTYEDAIGVLTKGSEKHTFTNGRLTKIVDEFQNALTINYSSGRISSVVDGVGRQFVFQYDGNFLVSITAPNATSIQFEYCNGFLSSATYPNGQKISFSYSNGYQQPAGISVSGSEIDEITTEFTYQGSKVSKIATRTGDVFSKKYTEFEFDSKGKQTIVREIDGDENDSDRMKFTQVYFHEHPNKNYSYYETGNDNLFQVTDPNGVILPYTEPGMNIGSLRCENLLKNHNFKLSNLGGFGIDMTDWTTNLNDSDRTIQFDSPEKMPGKFSANLISLLSADREKGMWQTVTLDAGQSYVFSCYLKLAIGNSNPEHGVYLMVKNSSGTVIAKSKMINKKKEFQRVALPFVANASYGTSYTVGIYIDGNTKAKVIAPQLEQGTMVSPYNYLSSEVVSQTVVNDPSSEKFAIITDIKVPAAKDAKETFTLSGYAKGGMDYSGAEAYAALKAKIVYIRTTEETDSGMDAPFDEFDVPVYTIVGDGRFVMLQFSKKQYRVIDHIEIICENNYNSYNVTFYDLQLVRNTYVDGLTQEDFAESSDNYSDTVDEEYDESSTSSSDSEESDDVETIIFEEVMDVFGNALTGTNFKNGEFGTIYTEHKFADSDPDDSIGDAGNNKTEEVDARGNVTRYKYDPITSKPIEVIDRCNNKTEYTYDAAGRTKSITAPDSGTVSYEYNNYDDLTKIERGDGQKYTMDYDAYRNLTAVNVGGQNLVTYDYKTGGNRFKSMTYANGAVQNLTYDRFGNVIGESWNDEMAYRYFYDASNQLVKTLDIGNKKMYNINRVGENVTSIEEYDVESITVSNDTYAFSGLTLVGTMHYSFDSEGKQFRKKYVAADGTEQKYVFEFQDEQNVAVQLPTGVVSHSKSDHFGRKVFDELQLGKGFMSRTFTYHEGEITQTHLDNNKRVSKPETTLVKQIEFADGRTIQYEYDAEERITKVVDSVDGTCEYTYDALGQLITETVNEVEVNKMTYDSYGNIKTKNGKTYTYDSTWRDKLLSTGDGSIGNYDLNGNPRSYLGNTLVWEKGRQLKQFGANTYKYNNEGIRISKTVNGIEHKYTLDGTNIVKEVWGSNVLIPLYDLDGTVCGIKYNGTAYYFYKNLQGDVIAITNDVGATIARYTYDAWGKVLTVKDESGNIITSTVHIANINPFRYRSYYYDTEIGMYYLQSRCYDPIVGRFINADSIESGNLRNETFFNNLFAYCENDAVNNRDENGNVSWRQVTSFLEGFVKVIKKIVDWLKKVVKELLKIYTGLKWQDISSIAKEIGRSPHRVRQSVDRIITKLNNIESKIGKLAIGIAILSMIATLGKQAVHLGSMVKAIAYCVVETCVSLLESLGEKALKYILKLIPFVGAFLSLLAGAIISIVSKTFLTEEKKNAIKTKIEGQIRITQYKLEDYFKSFFTQLA